MKRLLPISLAALAAISCSAPTQPAAPDASTPPPSPPPPPSRGETSAPPSTSKLPPGAIAWSDDAARATPEVEKSRQLGALSDFTGFSADEQEFIYAKFAPGPGFVLLHVVSTATSAPVRDFRLESPAAEQAARAWLVERGFQRLAESGSVQRGKERLTATATGLEVKVSLGATELWKGNPFGGPVPTSSSATVRVIGSSPKGSFAVVRAEVDAGHEFGKAVGVQVVKLP